MFGYVRPYKPNLRIKDFTHYRAIYCGMCKTIKRNYGEIPRLATNYDLTFMAVILFAFQEEGIELGMERCIANPIKAHGIAQQADVLEFTAATAILLAAAKIQDNIDDGDQALLNRSAKLFFHGPAKKAAAAFPDLADCIQQGMYETAAAEEGESTDLTAPQRFGQMLAEIFMLGLQDSEIDVLTQEALRYTAADLGQWVYYMDALEDYDADLAKGEYSALQELDSLEIEEDEIQAYFAARAEQPMAKSDLSDKDLAFMRGNHVLADIELRIDQNLALLTYKHYAELVSNVVCDGLFQTRMEIIAGKALARI